MIPNTANLFASQNPNSGRCDARVGGNSFVRRLRISGSPSSHVCGAVMEMKDRVGGKKSWDICPSRGRREQPGVSVARTATERHIRGQD